jgi:hypothetical protein
MNKALGIALLVVGVILLVWGLNAEGSFGSEVSKTFTGHPTDKTMWLIIGGAASGLTGLGLLLFGGRQSGGAA